MGNDILIAEDKYITKNPEAEFGHFRVYVEKKIIDRTYKQALKAANILY